jgi:hypothetical protein
VPSLQSLVRSWSALSRNRKRAALLLVLNVALFVAVCVAVGIACGRASTSGPVVASVSATATSASASASADPDGATSAPIDPRDLELWSRATDGGDEDLARLAQLEGSAGLVERGAEASRRMTALRALAYVHDFVALPWLAEIATGTNDAEAAVALDSIAEIAAQPRRAVDPEDGAELRVGCDRLLVLAKSDKAQKDRRIVAIRALRMMLDRGCTKADEIPTELDAK